MKRVKKLVQSDERGRVSLKPLLREDEIYLAELDPTTGVISLMPIRDTALANANVRVHGNRRRPAGGGSD